MSTISLVTPYINAVTFALLGTTFWIMSVTAQRQGRKWQGLRFAGIMLWLCSATLFAIAITLSSVAAR